MRAIRDLVRRHRWPLASGLFVFVASAVAFRVGRAGLGYWTIDDAGVTYASALELVDHHTLAPCLECTPIEGYSNPLLFFVTVLLRWVGIFDPVRTHVVLEMLGFAAMVTLAWSVGRSVLGDLAGGIVALVFIALELVVPATHIWYGSGLENVWVAGGLVLMLVLCERAQRGITPAAGSGGAMFLIAIARPEAPAYVAAFYAALFALGRPADRGWREQLRCIARPLAVTGALFVAFMFWRRIGYSAWLPNTYYAKLHTRHALGQNVRDYVVPSLFSYCRTACFAASVIGLLLVPRAARFAPVVLVFLVASLALPVVAGMDWMGEHRFGTPFIALAHLTYALFLAACVTELATSPRDAWLGRGLVLGLALLGAGLLRYDRLAIFDSIEINDVTVSRIAELEGGQRWEQQVRLGLPYPVVQIPDAGGTLLVGAMQILDNGYLTDFQMSRIGRTFVPGHRDFAILDQYQLEERRPDLLAGHKTFPVDRSVFGTRYLRPGSGVLWVRRDLVDRPAVPPGSLLLYEDAHARISLSPETVWLAAPAGLVRCELIVEWLDRAEAPPLSIAAAIAQGDRDELALRPYVDESPHIETFALLLGAPPYPGSFLVSFTITCGEQSTRSSRTVSLDVATDAARLQRGVDDALGAPSPLGAASRLAWLREQQIPRLGMTAFHALLARLQRADRSHSASAGKLLLHLRDNARLATREQVAAPIRTAEVRVARRLFETCGTDGLRIVCLGRQVDQLRRLGYLGMLVRVPEIDRELRQARANLAMLPADACYQTLVGLTLAIPGDIALQWQLLEQRRELARATVTFPPL